MTTESRISRLEGAYEQINSRLRDSFARHLEVSERLEDLRGHINTDNGSLREAINSLRRELRADNASLREEINGLRREINGLRNK